MSMARGDKASALYLPQWLAGAQRSRHNDRQSLLTFATFTSHISFCMKLTTTPSSDRAMGSTSDLNPYQIEPKRVGFAVAEDAPATFAQNLDYDVAIIGGGVAGLTLAAALKDSGMRIAVIEPQPQAEAIAKAQAYAVQLSSSQILKGIGVWQQIEPQVQHFSRVKLSDADYPHSVDFVPADLKQPVLGFVAEHRVLAQELLRFLADCPAVELRCPERAIAYRQVGPHVELDLQNTASQTSIKTVRVALVVGADGSQSAIRQQAGIETSAKAYWQSCLVATIQPEKFHDNVAYERFWPSGPFAILPVSKTTCRIVWTAPHAEAQRLLQLDDAAFTKQLRTRYGPQMGRLSVVGQRYVFPTKLVHARKYVRSRVALVGDAAHSCHPVGGQGLNLGIRDVAALAEVLQTAYSQGEDIGSLAVLRRYQSWRRWQNILSLRFTDVLNRTFSNQIFPVVVARRFGLHLMTHIPMLKVFALRFMAGLIGRLPTVAKLHSTET